MKNLSTCLKSKTPISWSSVNWNWSPISCAAWTIFPCAYSFKTAIWETRNLWEQLSRVGSGTCCFILKFSAGGHSFAARSDNSPGQQMFWLAVFGRFHGRLRRSREQIARSCKQPTFYCRRAHGHWHEPIFGLSHWSSGIIFSEKLRSHFLISRIKTLTITTYLVYYSILCFA